MSAPEYPGYKKPCNECGLCCITGPCEVSVRMSLWQDSRCIALDRQPTANVCKVITDPESLGIEAPIEDRLLAIGAIGLCDHRAAWTITDAKALLAERNVVDEHFGIPGDTYPRCCVFHAGNGKKYFCTQHERCGDLDMVEMIV